MILPGPCLSALRSVRTMITFQATVQWPTCWNLTGKYSTVKDLHNVGLLCASTELLKHACSFRAQYRALLRRTGVVVDEKLNVSQWCVPAAWKAGAIHEKRGGQQNKRGDCSPLLRPHEATLVVLQPGLGPPAQEECGAVIEGPEDGPRLEHLP